jgi:hypothetical protein
MKAACHCGDPQSTATNTWIPGQARDDSPELSLRT